jgi:hypothetical protein
VDELAARLAGPSGLTASASTFGRREVIQAICEQLPDGAPAATIEALADQLLTRPDLFMPLHADPARQPSEPGRANPDGEPDAKRAWTTPELLQVEADVLATATRRQHARVGLVDEPTMAATIARYTLQHDQAAMLRALTTSGHGVQVVNAAAGTGKTHTLDACRHA